MIERLLRAVFRHQDITHAGDLYLRRFLLTPNVLGWRLMLHRICRPDLDRALHDHPWDFATVCVRGGYVESVLNPHGVVDELLPVGGARLRSAIHTHRIDRLINGDAWTLVLHGPRFRRWGFWTDLGADRKKFTESRDYFNQDYDKASEPHRAFGG